MAMTIQIRATITGYPNEEETFTEIIDVVQSSERCEHCGRGAEVLSFEEPMVEPETGPSHICLRCLGQMADYEVIGLSIRCDWDLGAPIQPANPEVGRCESCEVDGLTVYRFRIMDFKEPEGERGVAVCRQCFDGGFAPANGYSLVVE